MHSRQIASLAALLLLTVVVGSMADATAQTVTVTISTDDIDIDWQNGTIADLPGPDGEVSFSEAMIATNNTPGHQTIGFAIPQSDWQLQFVLPGRAVLTSLTGYFFRAFDEVTIDGTTQTDYTGDTNPDGWEVAIYGDELYLNADGCTLIGFDSTNLSVTGSNGLVQGNTGSMNITVYGGSGSLIEGNEGGTIKIDRSSDNIVVGNTVNRVRVLGWIGGGQPAANNRIGGPNPEDRNYLTGYGTYNSEGMPAGTTLQIFDTVDLLVENNSIGTTPDGLESGNPASTIGVGFEGENHGAIILNNRIAGILGIGTGPHHAGQVFGWAILMQQTASNISIVGNTIGLNASDEPILGSVTGIDIGSFNYGEMTDIRIGGSGPGEGNVVAGHILRGIRIGREMQQARISGNALHDNGSLGIDLIEADYGDGVTFNDPLDPDAGANGLQNFPVLAAATRDGGAIRIEGLLNSYPSSEFTVEFFASPVCDGSGHGEGRVFLGTTDVVTDGAGDAGFEVLLPETADEGWVVTATATREPMGATSEFSACAEITGTATAVRPGDLPAAAASLGLPWPNPANPRINVELAVARAGFYRVRVLDAAGRSVKTLFAGDARAGNLRLRWDGRDGTGLPAASGLYLLELTGGSSDTQRFMLVR